MTCTCCDCLLNSSMGLNKPHYKDCFCPWVKTDGDSVYTVYELILVGVLFGVCTLEGFWQTLILAAVHYRALARAFLYCMHVCMPYVPLVEHQPSQVQAMEFQLCSRLPCIQGYQKKIRTEDVDVVIVDEA